MLFIHYSYVATTTPTVLALARYLQYGAYSGTNMVLGRKAQTVPTVDKVMDIASRK